MILIFFFPFLFFFPNTLPHLPLTLCALPSSEMPNYDVLIPVLLKEGIDQLPNHCKLTPGKQPIRRQNGQNVDWCVYWSVQWRWVSYFSWVIYHRKIKDTTKLRISSQLHCCQAICDTEPWHQGRKLIPAAIWTPLNWETKLALVGQSDKSSSNFGR